MSNLIGLFVAALAAAILYRLRRHIFVALQRFDARNAARAAEERRERHDRFAHYRHAVVRALEELEPVAEIQARDERTGQKVTRYLFLAVEYGTRDAAETARLSRAMDKARAFYDDLDQQFLGRNQSSR